MSIEHATITDPDIHEPKGVATATVGLMYLSDGLGSGAWGLPFGVDTALLGQIFIADGNGSGTWTTPSGAQFGSAYFSGNAVATTITTQGVDVILDPGAWATTVTDTIVFDTNKFTIALTGIYELHVSLSFAGGAVAGDIYRFSFAKNGVAIATSPLVRRQAGSTDIGNSGSSTFQLCTAGDEITMLVQNEDGTSNPTITDASFTLVLLKET